MEKLIPTIKLLPEKRVLGKRVHMNLLENKTMVLWQSFMPFVKDIASRSSNEIISMQLYPPAYFVSFNPSNTFEKWGAVEVSTQAEYPEGLEPYTIPGGLYAVFHYKGLSTDTGVFEYIFTEWLPDSDYLLDHRPHFEILGEKYKNNDPNSEEDIWIPIKKK